ncbi:GntR family transcriptional regulator [Collinsella sp. zg1085]|uniref:GntR family transcriptional regulator n=1 Tax=Collinsella sp. zg1085 TaxID=2844380 RepID=UPI001C0BCEDE|nr:GntR family transcriptional regulator [Collinsella sp. zg1085]QWT17814.1 GntR family transcriptional regulator [Collinsella sp. zg1085]
MQSSQHTPLYQQICAELKAAISSGQYAPKDKLPSEPELSKRYGVSRITVRRAVEELCDEGYVVKQQGRGTFVSSPPIDRFLLQHDMVKSFSHVCADAGAIPGAQLISREIIPAGAEEQDFLQLDEQDLVLHIRRLRTADNTPIFLENIFLPYLSFRELLTRDLNDCSIFETIAELTGTLPAHTPFRMVEAVKASAEQAAYLSISPGDPLLYLHAHFASKTDTPLCIGRQYYVGKRFRIKL